VAGGEDEANAQAMAVASVVQDRANSCLQEASVESRWVELREGGKRLHREESANDREASLCQLIPEAADKLCQAQP
jgi:hypothetical protein